MVDVVTRAHACSMVDWAKDKPEVVVLSGDLTKNTEADLFRDNYPERFFTMGLAEQNMLSVAGGFAREGMVPFVYTFSVFMYRRALDQLQMSIAYPNLKVRLLGFLPGLSTPGGVTHQAIDEIAITTAIPNMNVIAIGDATEVETLLEAIENINGPVYVSMMRGRVPRLFPKNEPLIFKKARTLSQGSDVAIFSSGFATEDAMRAVDVLKKCGVSVEHLHVSTLKPFDDPQVLAAISNARFGAVTYENHLVHGGLGSAVADMIAKHGVGTKLRKVGIKDTYAHGGSHAYLKKYYQLEPIHLINQVESLMGEKFTITEDEIAKAQMEPDHGTHKPEAL